MLTSVPYNCYWEQARHNIIMLSYYYKSLLPLTKQPNTNLQITLKPFPFTSNTDIVTQEKQEIPKLLQTFRLRPTNLPVPLARRVVTKCQS